jgi:hypothetical protein
MAPIVPKPAPPPIVKPHFPPASQACLKRVAAQPVTDEEIGH